MRPDELFAGDPAVRRRRGRRFERLALAATLLGVGVLALLLFEILRVGLPWLSQHFFTAPPSRFPAKAGFMPAIFGSLWAIGLTTLLVVPVGVAAALYLEEYSHHGRVHRTLEVLVANLAGVPSILYGILGLIAFVRMFDVFGDELVFLGVRLPLGRSVLAGALTLSLLVLPVVIIASREAIRAVPGSLRQAAFGLGATRWQVVRAHVLPEALPGIATGVVLAVSRALGETAPLIMIGALTFIAFAPTSVHDPFTAMPIQIFNWASRPQPDFHSLAAAGSIVLLVVLLGLNGLAIWLRNRFEKGTSR